MARAPEAPAESGRPKPKDEGESQLDKLEENLEDLLPIGLLIDAVDSDAPKSKATSSTPAETKPTKPTTYTTAGTPYKPESSAPFQRPARKNRIGWLHHQNVTGFVVPPPKFGLMDPMYPRPGSPTTTANTLKHYTPLQQNLHRAVTPPVAGERERVPIPLVPTVNNSPKNLNRVPPSSAPPLGPNRVANGQPLASNEPDNGDGGEEFIVAAGEGGILSQFNVKALTNLASYANPSQRAAQQALSRARAAQVQRVLPHPVALPLRPTNTSADRGLTSAILRGGQSMVATGELEHRNREALRSWARSTGQHSALSSAAPIQYPSTLSTGPGAPRPLTAGPPGHRLYKPATVVDASTTRGLTSGIGGETSAKPVEGDKRFSSRPTTPSRPTRPGSVNGARPSMIISPIGQPYELRPAGAMSSTGKSTSSFDEIFPPERAESVITETAFPDQVLKYYPCGLPADYKEKPKQAAPENWLDDYRPARRYHGAMSAEQVARTYKKIDEKFYSAAGGLTKSLQDVIRDASKRHLLRAVGRSSSSIAAGTATTTTTTAEVAATTAAVAVPVPMQQHQHQHQPHRWQPPKPLSVEEANGQSAAMAAEPLFCMAFATLLRYTEDGGENGEHVYFDVPDPWHLDKSKAGTQSFFAYKK